MDMEDKTRRESQGDALRRQSQGDVLRRPSQGDMLRRPSQSAVSQKQCQGDILKRSNKKYSVANAVAVIGVTKALLVGKKLSGWVKSCFYFIL
jgi:hypothetical protein